MDLTIQEIKKKWSELDGTNRESFIIELKEDTRKGVKSLINQYESVLKKEKEQKELFKEMSKLEDGLYASGFNFVCGIDEVGRGPLGGALVCASVVLPKNFYIPGLNDSKKLSEKAREKLYYEIKSKAVSIGIGVVSPGEIDELNIYQATKKGMKLAVQDLDVTPDYLLVDAMAIDLPIPQSSIVKGDSKSVSIAASSIIAKVTRDRMMKDLANEYPEYGFDQHMGYGTKQHLEAIKTYGICPEHRKSFAPIKDMV